MYIGWHHDLKMLQLHQYESYERFEKITKIPDYNIANFDVKKLPVLEVCFYTPRSGGETSVLGAITNMSCLSWSRDQ